MSASSTFSLRMLAIGLVIALAGTFTLTAFAREGHAGPHGGPGMFMGRGVERMLDGVNATPEQRSQIQQIMQAARTDLRAQRDSRRALHERSMQIFTQPTVDANAAEAVRQQMLAQHDQASKRMLQAMLDVSRVLTPEQRTKLGERMKQRREMMQRHMQERRSLEGAAPQR